MKKLLFLLACLFPLIAGAQTYPSPTFNVLTLQTPLAATSGGTGVSNSSNITLAGPLTTSGAFSLTLTTTAATNVTLPTSGTLLTSSGAAGLYAPIASPTFTGTVTIPSGASISGYAPLASPTFTGTVTIPSGASISGYAPLASPTFTGTVTIPTGASISGYALLASPTFTGTVTIPGGTINNTSVGATTASTGSFTSLQHSLQETDKSYTYNTPTTGTTVTIATGTGRAIIAPAGTLAALTVTLPACTTGYDGSLVKFDLTTAITALTVNATSGTVSNAPTAGTAGQTNSYICRGANTTWYPL
jgi:hypothetical protein